MVIFLLRYEDFFGPQSNKGAHKNSSTKKVKFDDRPQVKEIEYEETDDENVGIASTTSLEMYSLWDVKIFSNHVLNIVGQK
jgi:U3 small nucleolar ribonucleoprotein component